METQALIVVLIGQRVLGVKIARIDKVHCGLIVERCKVFPTVVMVVLHDLLALLDHVFVPCILLLLATVLFPLLGIRRESAGCCCGDGVLN